jgi:hypothetical protein
MTAARLCDTCRLKLTMSADAALTILSDARATDDERLIAADAAAEAVDILRLPAGVEYRGCQ